MRVPGGWRRLSVAAAVLAVLGVAPLAGVTTAEPLSLTIVHVNDWDRMAGEDGRGGAARIAAVVAEERARAEAGGGHAIVTFGGDMISPSLLSGIDKGAHMIALADAIGFDVAVLGNHEFDFGPEVLRERLSESGIVWLAGNVRSGGEAGFPGTRATTMIERGGYGIGFLGLVTPDTAEVSSPGEDVSFASVAETGAALARELKEAGADLVIALTHDGLSGDLELLRAAREIDVVLGGHDHLLIARYDGRQAVMKAGSQGRHVGVLDLEIDRAEGRAGVPVVVWSPDFRLRSTAGVAEDAAVAAMVGRYRERLDRDLGAVIGESATALDTRRASVRSGETAVRQPADRRHAGGHGQRRRADQRRRHPGRHDVPARRQDHPKAAVDRAAVRRQDGEAPPDGRRDQAGAGERRRPGRGRRGPVSAGLGPRVLVRRPPPARRARDRGHGRRRGAGCRKNLHGRDQRLPGGRRRTATPRFVPGRS